MTRLCRSIGLALTVAALCVVAQKNRTDECWDPVNQELPEPSALSCSSLVGVDAQSIGGIRTCCPNDGAESTNLVARYNIESHFAWRNLSLTGSLPPFRGQSACATHENTVLISGAAQFSSSSAEATDETFWLNDNVVTPGPRLLQKRRRGSLAEYNGTFYMVGGVDENNNPILDVERLDRGKNYWQHDGPVRNAQVCDCTSISHRDVLIFICIKCMSTLGHTLESPSEVLDKDLFMFFWFPGGGQTRIDPWPTQPGRLLSITASPIAQYAAVVTFYNTSTDPFVHYLDVSASGNKKVSWHHIATDYLDTPRIHGTSFVSKQYLYYIGGQSYPVKGHPAPLLTQKVDRIPVIKTENADLVDRANRTYYLGQEIEVRCQCGTRVRLATDVKCYYPAADTVDVECCGTGADREEKGVARLYPRHTLGAGFLCISLGTCLMNSNIKDQSMVPCPNGPYDNFRQCNRWGGCCWNPELPEDQRCYQYFEPSTASEISDLYYINADLNPISVIPRPSTPSMKTPFSKFASSPPGIICFVGGFLVILSVVGVLLLRLRIAANTSTINSSASLATQGSAAAHNVIETKYEVVKELGRGGFGRVFLVKRKSDGKELAMKYIPCSTDEDRGFAMKEFEVIRKAQGHPNMVIIYDVFMNWTADTAVEGLSLNQSGEAVLSDENKSPQKKKQKAKQAQSSALEPLLDLEPRFLCIIMTYAPEGDVAKHIVSVSNQGDQLSEEWILKVLAYQLCDVLNYLHTRDPPIVHRDMKPENVLLANNKTKVLITDFGLAQQSENTYMSTRAGSLHYVAPECWKRHYTETVDMWAIGCILYAAATGRCTANTARVMFNDARERGFQRELRRDLERFSPEFIQLVMNLLHTDPAKRLTAKAAMNYVKALLKKRESAGNAPSPTRQAADTATPPSSTRSSVASSGPGIHKGPLDV